MQDKTYWYVVQVQPGLYIGKSIVVFRVCTSSNRDKVPEEAWMLTHEIELTMDGWEELREMLLSEHRADVVLAIQWIRAEVGGSYYHISEHPAWSDDVIYHFAHFKK